MASAKATFIAILLAVATIGAVAQREIPEFLHICNTNLETRKFEQCVIESIMTLQPYLKTGMAEYNIPSLEPLSLKELTLLPTKTIHIQAKDVIVHGASNFGISKLKTDIKNSYFLVDVALPHIHVEGQYNVNGKLLLFTLNGSGPFSGNFTNCKGACRIQCEKYVDSNGLQKIRIKDFKMKITVGKGTIKFNNLFGDQGETLGEVINSAINNNFHYFLDEILPLLEDALSEAFTDTSEKIVEQFTYEQLFPGA